MSWPALDYQVKQKITDFSITHTSLSFSRQQKTHGKKLSPDARRAEKSCFLLLLTVR